VRTTTSNFIFQLNTCGYIPFVTSSLTRGWVCLLLLLLILSSAAILRFVSCGTYDHILLSQIGDSPNLESQVPVFVSPRKRVARLYPQALDSLSLPPTTRRATMDVFEPAPTRDAQDRTQLKSKSKLLYDWRFTANQFVLASSPLRPTIRHFFN
jgi:hypothetical protein